MENKVEFDLEVARRYRQLYSSATKRGKEFTLTFNDVVKLMKRKRCQYTNVVLTETESNAKLSRDTDRTFERIIPSEGYTPTNTIVVSFQANQLKEHLLEAKFKGPEHNHKNCVDFKVLKRFVSSLEKMGYKE